VRGVLRTKTAKLLELDASGVLFFIFRGRIIPALAIATFKGNDLSHGVSLEN
jgi:hypothetical protein